jgi:hypothetical protein
MSITPGVPTIQPAQTAYMPGSSYLLCKVCDRGSLSPKKVFRMSGPVVAIGFIILIPSILGIVFGGIMLIGVNNIASQARHQPIQSASNHEIPALEGKYSNYITDPSMSDLMPRSLKGANRADFVERLDVVGPIVFDGQYYFGEGCKAHECTSNEAAWVIDKMTSRGTAVIMKDFPDAGGVSFHEEFEIYGATLGNLPPPLQTWANQKGMTETNATVVGSTDTVSQASDTVSQAPDDVATGVAQVIDSGFAIAIGIGSFVGGLLGWLLVMRKRVLKCNFCGAVVNAS